MNRRGYIHWLIPVTLLVLIAGVIVAEVVRSGFLAVLTVLVIGGVLGHVVRHRQHIALFSLQAINLSFVVGFAATQDFMRPMLCIVLFYMAMAAVFYVERAFQKNDA